MEGKLGIVVTIVFLGLLLLAGCGVLPGPEKISFTGSGPLQGIGARAVIGLSSLTPCPDGQPQTRKAVAEVQTECFESWSHGLVKTTVCVPRQSKAVKWTCER